MGSIYKSNGAKYENAIDLVGKMLKVNVAEMSKLDLCRMILAQYGVIEELVDALHAIAPNHELLPTGRTYIRTDARGDSNGNVSVSENG